MYSMLVRALVRRGVRKLNEGDPDALLSMAAADAVLRFPGDNELARKFRPVVKGRGPHDTHRGLEECRAFAEEFVERGVQFVIEDILVGGPPWRTRVAMRAHVYALAPDGGDVYTNRAVSFLELRWGRLTVWEDYEDTQRSADWDQQRDRERSLSAG